MDCDQLRIFICAVKESVTKGVLEHYKKGGLEITEMGDIPVEFDVEVHGQRIKFTA